MGRGAGMRLSLVGLGCDSFELIGHIGLCVRRQVFAG